MFEVIVAATEWEPEFGDDHLAQTLQLATRLCDDTSVPRLLLADLNCDETQREYEPFMTKTANAWMLGQGDPAAVTLSSAVPFAPIEAVKQIDRRIDHILIAGRDSAAISVENAFTVDEPTEGIYPSDHSPVVVDLEMRGQAEVRSS